MQTLEKLDVAGQLMGKVFSIGGKFLKPVLNPISKKIKFALAEGVQFIRNTNLKISPSSNLYCGFPIFNIKLIRKGTDFTSDELRLLQSKVDEAIKAQGGLEKLPFDEFDNRIVEIDINGEKVPVIVGTESGLSKIDDGVSVNGAGKVFKVGDNLVGISIKQIKNGTNGKYAIIGRSMGNAEITGVRNVYSELKNIHKIDVEIFDASSLNGIWKTKFDDALTEFVQKTNNWTTKLSNQELLKLKIYKLNKEWAQHLVDDGYTIFDMGDFNNLGFSAFYSMEKMTIFK